MRFLSVVIPGVLLASCTFGPRSVSQAMIRPGEVAFDTLADVQAEVEDWYTLLVPSELPDQMNFDSGVFQVDMRDITLIYMCAETRLFIVHQFGYNVFSVPPGLPSNYQAPSFQSLASGITVRGYTPGYAVHGIYKELSWLETDAQLVITLIAETNGSSEGCQFGRTELLDLGNQLVPYSSD